MKIAIHSSDISYSDKWIAYCEDKNIPFKIVNCYHSDIIQHLHDCEILMWHYHHKDSRDFLVARQLLNALEATGKIVYPDFKTNWFFDDKIGQKYLLESINAPLIPSHVFYSESEALNWANHTSFPKVFKLRKGSGSANVRLIKSRVDATRVIKKAFNRGFRQYNPVSGMKERWRTFKGKPSDYNDLIKGLARLILQTKFEKIAGKEKGYVYFQDFIPGCTFDIRTTVIGNKCYALKRKVRENDFRASGSHDEIHSPSEIPIDTIKISFDIYKKLGLQSVAFDFLINSQNQPLIIEMSYAFGWDEGDADFYWDSELNFHDKPFNPFGIMIENLITKVKSIEK